MDEWTTDDEKDVRFYVWGAGAREDAAPTSNMGVQLAALEMGLRRVEVLSCSDPDGEMVDRLDMATRAAGVRRLLDSIERSDVEILVAAFGDQELTPETRTRFGELAGVVVYLAREVDLRVDCSAALAEAAAARLEAAKQAYARARRQAVT